MRIGIIGGGVTGLTAAYKLTQTNQEVTIIESSNSHAGLAMSFKLGESYIENFYHHIFTSDSELIDLCTELGISEKLLWLEPKNAIFINNTLYPFSTPKDLLTFKEIPFINRFLMGLMVLRAKSVKDWKSLENVSAKDWIISKAGKSVYDKVWGPLLNSKFDIDSQNVSAVWLWNKFKLRGSTRSKGGSKELLGYMDGGFELIYEKMAEIIQNRGGKLLMNESLTEISENTDNTINVTTQKGSYTFDKVIMTFAPDVLNSIKHPFDANYMERVKKIKYKSNICMLLELNTKITPYYWITVSDPNIPFVVFVEHTNLIKNNSYGKNIVYLSRYLDSTDELFGKSDEEIADLFLKNVHKVAPNFKISDILKYHVARAKYAQPVVFMNYSDLKLEIQTPIKNIVMGNMANIYPEDRGQNYAVRLGKELSDCILGG